MKQLVIHLREDEYRWLRSNIADLGVPWREPLVWQLARDQIIRAIEAAADSDSGPES